MIPTVREVLALPLVTAGQPEVVGGAAHLDQPVRWVHISESSDPTGLLQGGELVLTTGLPLVGEPAKVSGYLHSLSAHGARGLIVELGTHLSTIPEGLGAAADSAGLPVVALARPIRFVEVTQRVHQMIIADRYEELEFARTTHEVFTSLNIARASTADIVARASRILAAPLVLEDLNRHVLAFSAAGHAPAELLENWAERSRRDSHDWSAVTVGLGPERWARLVLPVAADNPTRATTVLERAAQSLQLRRMIEQDRDALLGQAHGGLLEELRGGQISDEAEAITRATALGLRPGSQYAPLVVRSPRRPQQDVLDRGELDRALLTAVRRAVDAAGHTAILTLTREGTVACLISCDHADSALATITENLRRHRFRIEPESWVAGTAAPSSGVLQAAHGLAEAAQLAEAGLSLGEAHRLYRTTDVRLRGLLTLLQDDHRLQAFAERELGPLLDHDARTGPPLLPLLRTHLENGGAKTRTAEQTGLSRPTLYSRLSTLERILGVPLDSPESRTSLHVALMILDSRGHTST
ncbi:PucR family transcriptional regulator [Amycolatopsis albispora]|uniref:PucR family transcriptional regulator n=1 Tax=Amycolatopsis albispora TaxID=1804986 RepID=A0A344L026_9PSEU|nr:PucR family transcriptional regulator [Amycolatopsis albispora]AXB41400.1 PucR family transcriptional regulator [Amycolatopsis albispora]